jgi:hypothetical protein
MLRLKGQKPQAEKELQDKGLCDVKVCLSSPKDLITDMLSRTLGGAFLVMMFIKHSHLTFCIQYFWVFGDGICGHYFSTILEVLIALNSIGGKNQYLSPKSSTDS